MNTTPTLRLIVISSLLFTCSTLHAQEPAAADTIFLRNGTHIVARVDEIGLDEIQYHGPNDTVRVSVEKDGVSRIHLHNGQVITMTRDAFSTGYSAEVMRKTHSIKIEVLSFAADHVTMSYETMLKPWMNLEVRATAIGIGNGNMQDQCSGFAVAGGIKFIARPDHVRRGMKLGHPLQGHYIRPEILYNRFTSTNRREESYDWYNSSTTTTYRTTPIHYTNMAFNIILGKQRFLGDGVTFDTWVGIGYGIQTVNSEDPSLEEQKPYCYNYTLLGTELPITLSAGMTLGIAF